MRLAGLLRVGLVIAALATLAGCGDDENRSRTATAEGPGNARAIKATAELLDGIPQDGAVLGDPKAKVTFVEFIDPQCPFCKQFARDTYPTIVRDFVRTGKVRYETHTMSFLGPDSERGARFLYAAGLQGKEAQAMDLIYANQGAENTGYMTDAFLRTVGRSITGFDTAKALRDMKTPAATDALAEARTWASRYGVTGTPTLLVGPSGGDLERVPAKAFDQVDAYRDAVQHAVDQAD